jgi:hypothetical protein
MYAVLKKRDVLGIACVYIAVIQLTSFPYYMGRSMPHTLYGVSMPFIIVAGLLVDLAWKNRSSVKKDYVLVVGTFLCLFIIVLGALRGTLMMIPYGVAAASIGKESSAFIQSSINHWNTKDLPEYQFLVKHLPSGCPLLSVDAYEFDLLAALGVAPATQYAYVRGYIVSTEQIDTLKPKLPFCFFINQSEFNAYDTRFYYVYHILWEKASKGAQLIAEDSLQGFRLYKVTSWQ